MGVNIVEIDANGRFLNGTITDNNGNYVIKVSSGNANIQYSMIGFEKKVEEVNNRTRIDVMLGHTGSGNFSGARRIPGSEFKHDHHCGGDAAGKIG